ncbi:hypothetical protein T4D_9588 [Trichinella pseudospiralis]|uniref:Uncharacterized protein n=1 Tax=Trichinella pseudospiralis TaxID=6337 RepID=A0A0V1FQC6_TRIPS|nr:hypothetical protein T4D_9588 [Trichinella pseudospiralis]
MFFAVLSKGVEVTRLKTLKSEVRKIDTMMIQWNLTELKTVHNFYFPLNTVKLGLRFKVTQFASIMPNRLVSFYPMETSSAMSNRIWRNTKLNQVNHNVASSQLKELTMMQNSTDFTLYNEGKQAKL